MLEVVDIVLSVANTYHVPFVVNCLIRNIIEDAIRSEENQFECHMPDLPLNSPEMVAFLKTEPPIQCDDVEPWVVCGHSKEVSPCPFDNQLIIIYYSFDSMDN